jgi:flagellar export protein FliJ
MSGFRLDVVLRLRRLAEDGARARLATSLADHRAAALATERLAHALDAERDMLVGLQADGVSAGQMRDGHDAVEHAERSLETGRERLARAAEALLQARALLADASRQREVVERLRDRAKLAQRHAVEHAAEIELSEFATVRHAWAEIEEALR